MFRNKSAGILEQVTSALYAEAPSPSDEGAWDPRNQSSEKPLGLAGIDETYIAAAELTVTVKPFFRWIQ